MNKLKEKSLLRKKETIEGKIECPSYGIFYKIKNKIGNSVRAMLLVGAIGGIGASCSENQGNQDNSIYQTIEQALLPQDAEKFEERNNYGWANFHFVISKGFDSVSGKYFALATTPTNKLEFVLSDTEDGLYSSSLVPQEVGNSANLRASTVLYDPVMKKLIAPGDRQTTERLKYYDIQIIGNNLSIVNKEDFCNSTSIGLVNSLASSSIDSDEVIHEAIGSNYYKINKENCERETISGLDGYEGVASQLPDGSFVKGVKNISNNRIYLFWAPTLEDFINQTINRKQIKINGTSVVEGINPRVFFNGSEIRIAFEKPNGGIDEIILRDWCGNGEVGNGEVCDDPNCQSNCGACNAGFSADINGICQSTTFPDPDEPDVIEDIEDLTDFAEIIEDQHQEIALDAIDPDTTDTTDTTTPDVTDTTTPETIDTQTHDAKDPEIIIDPNCDEQINLETVYPNGSMKIGCFEDRIEINGTGEISVKLHEGLDPVKIIVGDDFANTGEITIFYPEIEGVVPAILLHIKGFYDIEKHGNLTNGRSQLEVNYVVNGATMALTPIGTRWTMKREELRDKDFSHLGEVKDGNVLVNVFDEEGKLIFSRNFVIGEKIYFTTNNVSTICAEGSACPFLPPIITEDLGADVLEGNDFAELPNGNTGSDGCGCMVVRSKNGETTLIPVFAGLLALGLTRLLRRRKED